MKLSDIRTIKEAEPEGQAAERLLDLKALAKYYATRPEDLKRKLSQLWGEHRLTYNGQKFIEGDNSVYQQLEDAVEAHLRGNETIEMSLNIDNAPDIDGNELSSLEWKATISKDEMQEVYLGYSPRFDSFFIGYDAWLNEDEFNEAFDEAFEAEFGEEFDTDNHEHDAVFKAAFEEYKDAGMLGLLYKVDLETGDVAEELAIPGGFYRGIYNSGLLKNLKLIDLRLD